MLRLKLYATQTKYVQTQQNIERASRHTVSKILMDLLECLLCWLFFVVCGGSCIIISACVMECISRTTQCAAPKAQRLIRAFSLKPYFKTWDIYTHMHDATTILVYICLETMYKNSMKQPEGYCWHHFHYMYYPRWPKVQGKHHCPV